MKKLETGKFSREFKKLIKRIIDNPSIGKPLKYDLAGLRSLRITPFRIIYDYRDDAITLIKF